MKCLDYFYFLLGRKEYSAFELRKKAKEKGFPEEEINPAIDHLQEIGYQSDTRLIEVVIKSSQGKYGKSVIKRKCLEKGISLDLFAEVWEKEVTDNEEEEEEDFSQLKDKIQRKYKIETFKKLDPKTKGKLIQYLQYRGFNPFELLSKWQDDDD